MREQILKLLHKIPFQPFSVDVAADVAYSIPTPDHVLAAKNVLVIEDDAGLVDVIPYAHIRRISFASASNVIGARFKNRGSSLTGSQDKQEGFFFMMHRNPAVGTLHDRIQYDAGDRRSTLRSRQWIRERALDFNAASVGRQRSSAYEIDVAAVNTKFELTVVGECKWSENKLGISIFRELE